jgi:DNA-binding winged helix-turn-helix (wHTH) protein
VRVAFGDCEFDTVGHVLRRHGRAIPLSPRAFRLLEVLLDRRPEVISKADLLEQLWPGTFVSDASLHNLVTEVRAAIGDTPQASRFIRTVPRCGYGFHGDAREATTTEPLTSNRAHIGPLLISKQHEWSLSEGSNLVGRDRDCAVSIDSPGVSRRHARIVVSSGAATIEDLGSKNGTYLNGQLVTEATTLDDGSQMRVGPVTMVFRRMGALPSTVTQRQRKV